jgi:hypothetical protein
MTLLIRVNKNISVMSLFIVISKVVLSKVFISIVILSLGRLRHGEALKGLEIIIR